MRENRIINGNKIINTNDISPAKTKSPSMPFVRKTGRKLLTKTNNCRPQQQDLKRSSNSSPYNLGCSTVSSSRTIDESRYLISNSVKMEETIEYRKLLGLSMRLCSNVVSEQQQTTRQEKRKYRDQSLNKCKQLRKVVQQNQQLADKNSKLIEGNKKLQLEKTQLTKKIKFLQGQLLSQSILTDSNKSTYSITSLTQTNPFQKLKNLKKFGNDNSIMPLTQQTQKINIMQVIDLTVQQSKSKSQFEERYYMSQKYLFEARQQIKRLTLQLDCVRMKAFTDVQVCKKAKHEEYLILQKKFKQLLKQHIEIMKANKKIQITNKVRNATSKNNNLSPSISRNSSYDLISLCSLSSDDQSAIKQKIG